MKAQRVSLRWNNKKCLSSIIIELNWIVSREGVIIECPLNYLFHDVVTVILTSQMGVSEMVVNVGNVVTVIYGIIHRRQTVIFRKNHDF